MTVEAMKKHFKEELGILDGIGSCALLEIMLPSGHTRVVKRGTLEYCVEQYNTLQEKYKPYHYIVTDAECSKILSESY